MTSINVLYFKTGVFTCYYIYVHLYSKNLGRMIKSHNYLLIVNESHIYETIRLDRIDNGIELTHPRVLFFNFVPKFRSLFSFLI